MVNEIDFSEFIEFENEMNRLRSIKYTTYADTLKKVGITYLGAVAQSTKLLHSLLHHESTYCIYLSSGNLSGFEVCNKEHSKLCRENCLMGSGQNRVNRMSTTNNKGVIDRSRNTKTRLFFANREVFMRLIAEEIKREKAKAISKGNSFSVRINATSDINPIAFALDGKNLFELFPNVMFYDYTKVPSRIALAEKYNNYDITWSIDGDCNNETIGLEYLSNGGRVAVVFGTETLPKKWHGYEVIDGDKYDMRYRDGNVVVGLKFKKTANNYINGHFVMPNTKFIVTEQDRFCEW